MSNSVSTYLCKKKLQKVSMQPLLKEKKDKFEDLQYILSFTTGKERFKINT